MVLSIEEFEREYPDESDFVEFKTGLGRKAIQEAAVAFSNAHGGVILVGVDDHGTVVGLKLNDSVQLEIHEAIGAAHNPGRYDIASLVVGANEVVAISIEPRREGFAQTSSGRPLIRRGKSNVPLVGDELFNFAAKRAHQRYESTPIDVPLQDADPARLDTLRRALNWQPGGTDEIQSLEALGLVSTAEGSPVLTVAGGLYLIGNPESVLGKAYIEVFRYPDDSPDYDKRITINGPANDQVHLATEAILDELGTDLVVLGSYRHELPRLPPVVVREAIANAVAHRQYELNGSSIRVELRPDVVTITSPGTLPEPVTVKNIRQTEAARNIDVIRMLRRFGLAEDAGRGVDVMQDEMRGELLDPPEFVEHDSGLEVRLKVRSTVTPRERAWVREIERRGEIRPADRVLLVHAARDHELTNSSVRDLLGVDSTEARQALQRLRDSGFLEQRGTKGGTHYRLRGDLSPPAGLRLGRQALADLVLAMAHEEGSVTNALVRKRTGVDRPEALRILGDLVADGRLEKRGSKRGTHYVPGAQMRIDAG